MVRCLCIIAGASRGYAYSGTRSADVNSPSRGAIDRFADAEDESSYFEVNETDVDLTVDCANFLSYLLLNPTGDCQYFFPACQAAARVPRRQRWILLWRRRGQVVDRGHVPSLFLLLVFGAFEVFGPAVQTPNAIPCVQIGCVRGCPMLGSDACVRVFAEAQRRSIPPHRNQYRHREMASAEGPLVAARRREPGARSA